jgi:uncharacterized membrane protein YhaH (DUF805 family)
MSDASSTPSLAPIPAEASLPSGPAEGWYPDVEVPGSQRWWDGVSWTDHRQPPAAPALPYGSTAVQPYAYGSTAVQPYAYAPTLDSQPPLWAPWYGISFGAAVRRGWKKYAAFDGRASLSEYWWFALFSGIIGIGGYVLILVAFGLVAAIGAVGAALAVLIYVAYLGFALAILVPSIAIAVRRLHDAGYSGLLYLLALVPFGSIAVLVFTLMPSSPAGAQYDRPV